MKPKMLDMCCCAGGATRGYQHAGWHVTGADLRRHPRHVGDAFIEGDALALDPGHIRENFDAAHASPPCQGLTEMNNDKSRHENIIAPMRRLLDASGVPYTIENVRAAREHLVNPISLFGTMFDCHMVTSAGQRFVLSRERLFETNWPVVVPEDPGPQGHPIANVFGGHLRARSGEYRTGKGTGRTVDFPGEDRPALARQLMGMPWASMGEMSEAVPPAYTEWLGRQLLDHLQSRAAA